MKRAGGLLGPWNLVGLGEILALVAGWDATNSLWLGFLAGGLGAILMAGALLVWEFRAQIGERTPSKSRSSLTAKGRRRPSLTNFLLTAACHRLPAGMSEPERERWIEEMSADVVRNKSLWRRWPYAFGIWRRGAPEMPVGDEALPRTAPW